VQEVLVGDVVDRQQLDGGDAEVEQVRDRSGGRQAAYVPRRSSRTAGLSFVKPLTWTS
jgi:hypothetical protein